MDGISVLYQQSQTEQNSPVHQKRSQLKQQQAEVQLALRMADTALQELPQLSEKIQKRKEGLLIQMQELTAYITFIDSLEEQ